MQEGPSKTEAVVVPEHGDQGACLFVRERRFNGMEEVLDPLDLFFPSRCLGR
jgi:hypothetical protein